MADITEEIIPQSSQLEESTVRDAKLLMASSSKGRSAQIDPGLEKLKEEHRHQIDMLKYGWFGKLFGAEENSSKALTFTLVFFILSVWLSVTILTIWFPDTKSPAIELFKEITPVLTLAFGYFFGKK